MAKPAKVIQDSPYMVDVKEWRISPEFSVILEKFI
jgi:hypothetical protein